MALLYLVFSKLRFSFRTLVAFLLNLTFFFFLRFCHKNIRRLPVIHVKLFPWMEAQNPGNTRLDEDVLKTSFGFFFKRHLQDVFKTSWWRRTYSYQSYVSKTSWSRPIYWSCPFVFKTSSRRFQDIFKTSCHNVFKTFSRRLQDVLPKRLQDVSQIRLEDIYKTFWRRIIKLNCFC